MQSKIVHLRDLLERDPENNLGTCLAGRALPRPFDAEALFRQHYGRIRAALERHAQPGVLVMAFDDGAEPLARAWVAASADRPRALIVGRHSSCELYVPGRHEEVSLRHLGLIVSRAASGGARIRAVDLHTSAGFSDDEARSLESVTADGPLFLAIGPVRLVILVTDAETRWPEDAAEAYAKLPPRVFVDLRSRFGARQLRAVEDGQTLIQSYAGPLGAGAPLLEPDEPVAATLTLSGPRRSVTRELGARALERGVVVGRADRSGLKADIDGMCVSRVHALLIAHEGRILVMDTGSSNGTFVNGAPISVAELADGELVSLAGDGDFELWIERS